MTRNRTKGTSTFAWVVGRSGSPLTVFKQLTGDRISDSSIATIADVSIPQFNKLRSHGEIFMNPLRLYKESTETNIDTMNFGPRVENNGTWVWGPLQVEGALACYFHWEQPLPAWFATRVADARAQILTRAHARIESADIQGLVTIAEAVKTAKMLMSPFRRADELITQMRKRARQFQGKRITLGDRAALKQVGIHLKAQVHDAKSAAEAAWLEYRFGWKPVIYEISQAVDAWVNRLDAHDAFLKPVRKVARASTTIEWDSGEYLYFTPASEVYIDNIHFNGRSKKTSKVAAGVLYELYHDTFGAGVRTSWGSRLADIPAAAWELVPLSFVVDRFVAVGDWLQAITPKPGVRVLASWLTQVDIRNETHRILDANVTVNGPGSPANKLYTASGGRFRSETVEVNRSVNPLLPILPPVNTRDLNWQQYTDHAALITSRLVSLRSLR